MKACHSSDHLLAEGFTFLVAQSAWWNACIVECHVWDLRVTESYHAFVPSSINTLGSGLCVSLLLLHRGLMLAHPVYQHWALGVFWQSASAHNYRPRVTPSYKGLSILLPSSNKKKSLCVQMKIEEGDRDMAGYCWSAPAISTLEVTEDPMSDIYQSPSLQI